MPAFGKAKSHNWVEADNAFGDFDAMKVFQDNLVFPDNLIFQDNLVFQDNQMCWTYPVEIFHTG